jgi:ribosomal protein S25
LAQIETALKQIDQGIEKPFLSMIGFTTPTVFDKLVTFEMTTNGFFGRAVLVNERETNPRAKRRFKKTGLPAGLELQLASLYSDGDYDVNKTRIEYYGKRHEIKYTKEAALMMDKCLDWIEDHAEVHKERTGLEAVIRRGYELIAKVALILGAPEGLINEEHVRWAFALIHRDLEEKTRLAFANDNEKTDPLNALSARIMSLIDKESGATRNQMKNRLRVNVSVINQAITRLENLGLIDSITSEKEIVKYFKK